MILAAAPRFLLLVATITVGCAATPPTQPPTVKLEVPQAFHRSLAVQHFQIGEDVLHIDWMPTHTMVPMTQYEGIWPAEAGTPAKDHHWRIDVYSGANPRVAAACAHAKDGYDADLDELVEFLLTPRPRMPVENARRALSYLFARFERKHFRWGSGISFLSQKTQDTGMYAPMNTHLRYEIWGLTKDGRCTVVASVRVGHPKLPDWPHVRNLASHDPELQKAMGAAYDKNDYRAIAQLQKEIGRSDQAALKNDPDYKLIERCSPDEFEPSLAAFDALVNELGFR